MDPKLQRGPTIPFILGACRDPLTAEASPQLGEHDLRRLLAALQDETPEPYCIEILLCPYLKTYVASARIEPPTGRVRIPSPNTASRALYCCEKIGEHDVRDFNSLVAAFWSTRGADILNGRFSRRGGNFRHFDNSDLENIKALRINPSPVVPSRLQPTRPIRFT